MADAWGGSWGNPSAWGDSWGTDVVPPTPPATGTVSGGGGGPWSSPGRTREQVEDDERYRQLLAKEIADEQAVIDRIKDEQSEDVTPKQTTKLRRQLEKAERLSSELISKLERFESRAADRQIQALRIEQQVEGARLAQLAIDIADDEFLLMAAS